MAQVKKAGSGSHASPHEHGSSHVQARMVPPAATAEEWARKPHTQLPNCHLPPLKVG